MSTDPHIELIRLLMRHGVPVVIVGGHAVNLHGFIRATEDVDLVWLRSPESEKALLAALTAAKAMWIANDIDPATGIERIVPVEAVYIRCEHLMMLTTDYGFLDLFDYVPGFPEVDPTELFQDSLVADGLRFVSREWLGRMKRKAGRTKDLMDLEQLELLGPSTSPPA